LWSSLHHAQTCPFADIESIGYAQPVVRSYAWALLLTLLENWRGTSPADVPVLVDKIGGDILDEMASLVPILSVAVLRSSFTEPDVQVRGTMWRPWLKFLKGAMLHWFCHCHNAQRSTDYPRAWEIDAEFESQKANEAESDEDDGAGEEEEKTGQPALGHTAKDERPPAFADFLQFLELGCGGSPLQGYPVILVILSSVPASVRASPATPTFHIIELISILTDPSTFGLRDPRQSILLFVLGRCRWTRA
jgi:E3 ubiquitin-protein ligase listerin